jgi:hypothetical protein
MHTPLHLNSIKAKKKLFVVSPLSPSLSTTHYFQTISIRPIQKRARSIENKTKKKNAKPKKKESKKFALQTNIAQEN